MNTEQLGELVLASQDSLYRVARTLLRNEVDCSDAISETIVKAFSKIHTLRKDAYAKTWLIRILMNECYAIMRKEKRIVSIEDYPASETDVYQEDYSDLYEALMNLPEEMRTCVALYYLEGYSVKEIAELLAVTESAVKNRLLRARRRLKADLTAEAE